MYINVTDASISTLAVSIRFFNGRNLSEDISEEVSGWYEVDLSYEEASDEVAYWRTQVDRANAGLLNDVLEELTPAQIANGCEYVFEWWEVD